MSDLKAIHISCLHSFVDESFDIRNANSYVLNLQIDLNKVLLAVYDVARNKFIALEHFTLQNCFDFELLAQTLDMLAKQSKLWNGKYKTVNLILVNAFSTLVPKALYEEDRKKLFLKFNFPLQGNEMVCDNTLKQTDAICVFALPFTIKQKVEMAYNVANVNYFHFSSSLLDTVMLNSKNQTDKRVYVNIQQQHFEIIVIENRNLIFYNSFNYFTAEDFMYYLLFVCEQLHINPEQMAVLLMGDIERNSNLYALLQKYVRNISFLDRNNVVEYSHQLQRLPLHSYHALFTVYSV
jgi:Protein of unknown function (DUF3822)